ncbi:ABC transporter substrate-binding protein, partial [Pseudonocardia abyssalis]|uniref:ABC transporter substrate-binding protein n=1 Tax=Pseudonocardia abyssalis TaxID=2792008 RepID=UPI001C5C0E54|nr:ABC transporter substrate-binding protein [Pseudonocardia abyssalis]
MRSRRVAASLAVGVSVALFASACGGGGGDSAGGAGGDGAAATISVYSTEPENPLVPSNTNEVGGGKVIDSLFSNLVSYETEDAAPYNEVAESIETTDSQNYTITLKDWTFHDGTPVTSSSFVDAWNFAAYGPNAQQNSSFFSQIQGLPLIHISEP